MNQSDIISRARAIIAEAVNAVLMTVDQNGFPHPRTMWTAGMDDDMTTYFVTGRELVKVQQIQANNKVCMFWTQTDKGGSYALLKGEARVTDDQSLRDRFWNDMLAEYFGRTAAEGIAMAVRSAGSNERPETISESLVALVDDLLRTLA